MRLSHHVVRTAVLLALLISLACAGQAAPYYQFIPSQGYFGGKANYYLLTDVSDPGYASTLHAHYTPRLGSALGNPYVPKLYYVSNYRQNLIFSAEWPAYYRAGSYMPIWTLIQVTWLSPAVPTVLKSAADVSAAAAAGKISLRTVRVAVGASIVVNSSGACIRQGRCWNWGTGAMVSLPVRGIFVGGSSFRMLQLDFSSSWEAQVFGGTYAPLLAQFNSMKATPPWQNVYSLWIVPPINQLPVGTAIPGAVGYSPLMNEWSVNNRVYRPTPFTSAGAILAVCQATATYNMNYQPILYP